ncbi:MAG: site-specific integrase [Phycisphaeraceae bacterium]|nr:site-specific integrase [Phycisphaeraceae bacterium]
MLTDDGLAPATIAKRVKVARAIFGKAVLWKAIDANPFAHIKSGSQANSARSFHVPREWLPALFDACPSDEWRAIIGLSRLAGLRCPSELAPLTWGSVDWDKGVLRVQSPKTAGHEGQDERYVPIDPDLYAILDRLYHDADEGVVAIVPSVRDGSVNLRTGFRKIIARASLKVWPRLFHNMRAACITDWLTRPNVTVADVAEWAGHSPVVAATHYWQPRPSAIREVTGRTPEATRQTTQHRAEPGGTGTPVGAGRPTWNADSGVCQPVPSTERTTNDPSGIRTRVATVKG